jgi:hypothetical protein
VSPDDLFAGVAGQPLGRLIEKDETTEKIRDKDGILEALEEHRVVTLRNVAIGGKAFVILEQELFVWVAFV